MMGMRGWTRLVGGFLLATCAGSLDTGVFAAAVKFAPMSDAAVRARVDALLAQMTPEEKAGQLVQKFDVGAHASMRPDADIVKGKVGSLAHVTNPAQANRLQKIAIEQSRLKIPLLFAFDVTHGLRTIFPTPIGMAASWDPQLEEMAQAVAASEARAAGIHWTFSPMVDIARDPRWGRVFETAGEDPYLGSVMARAQVIGFQGPYLGSPGHIIAGPKHFAGLGAAPSRRDYDAINLSDDQFWNVYLPPFKAVVEAGAGNITSANIAVNGAPASADKGLLTHVLRDGWGFKGFVLSDPNALRDLKSLDLAADDAEAAGRALTAGLDMEMVVPGAPSIFTDLPRSVESGAATMADLDRAARLVLEAKARMGLFDQPYVDEKAAAKILADPKHREAARIAAERSAVLLRNEGGLLPLNAKSLKSIAVLGPLADSRPDMVGGWASTADPGETVTILDGIRRKVGKSARIGYSPGVAMPTRSNSSSDARAKPQEEDAEIKRAVALAADSDVAILVLGESQAIGGELRTSLDLQGRQIELLRAVMATGKPVVLLLINGRPVNSGNVMPQAVLDMWNPGTQGGAAAANLLFGDVSPGGKLPFTWPTSVEQLPLVYSNLLSRPSFSTDKHGWDVLNKPLYPFGFGLSYSSFAFSNLKLDREKVAPGEPLRVSVDVRNIGDRVADEVAQLYIHQRYGMVARPRRELKGFQRVTLKPGETRTVHFALTGSARSYWSAITRSWVEEEVPFDLWVGPNSDADLGARFEVHK